MSFTGVLGTLLDLALVIGGFTLIIVLHELGHFLAARWARIRVLAFAVGFGPALVSFRKGLGWRRGSSEPAYRSLPPEHAARVSPTEYRLNILPLGGYVKMLGQDDADPSARSNEPDSYQNAPVSKRMVVISAGVVANLVSAAVLFIIVFTIGLKAEPPVIGLVTPGSTAATTAALNASTLGVTQPGLQPDDRVIRVNGRVPDSFNDLQLAAAMSGRNEPVRLEVHRVGLAQPLRFDILPTVDEGSRMLALNATPARTTTLTDAANPDEAKAMRELLDRLGLPTIVPGMTLVSAGGTPASSAAELQRAVDGSDGKPFTAVFQSRGNASPVEVTLTPTPVLMDGTVRVDDRLKRPFTHLLGLTPVMGVYEVSKDSAAQRAGIQPGDIFVQVGSVEWPSLPAGIAELQRSAGKSIPIAVARTQPDGTLGIVELGNVPVSRHGTLGFYHSRPIGGGGEQLGIVARWPAGAESGPNGAPGGALLGIPAGARISKVNGSSVKTLQDIRQALTGLARARVGNEPLHVELTFAPAAGPAAETPRIVTWTVSPDEVRELLALRYESPVPLSLFEPASTLIRGENVFGAVGKGVKETHRVMMMTYLTFARLFEGTVKIEHLKGPVGIAHVGVLIADRGTIWLLFFMALISVNLAVVNFLPLPIVDGGHVVYLIYERVTGRQPPIAFQNAAALVGLALIGTMFVIVTYHDVSGVISRLLG